MLIFIKRVIVLILIPAGLVLLFAPLDTFRDAYLEKDFVFLTAEPVSSEDKNVETHPLLTREQLKPYSQILTTVLARKERVETYKPSHKVADDVLGLESLRNTLSQMDGVSPEQGEKYKKEIAQLQKRVYDSKAEIHKIRLTGFSYLQKQWETEPTAISIEAWEQMKGALSFPDNNQTSFLFENTLFRGVVRHDYGRVNLPVPGLALGRRLAGAASLIMGLLLMTGLYLKKQGIMIAKTWSVLLWDIIVICFSVFFLYGAIDLLFMKLFETGMGTEEFIQFMGVFWVFLGIPAVALFISASAAQAVTISEKGIYLNGLFSKIFVSWDDLKDIEVSEMYSPKKVGGITAPRQLMKIMRLEGETSSITLMEPPLKSTKKRILDALLTHAPEKWKAIIEEQGKAWQAFL
ncbi:MAG: hypothetical protein JRL30_15645 [Deltaproteobacteria bacterium]|nr:hypothetical protein [Deltaproteobacteria bacterium]